jgi:hypothetical protein
MNLMLSRIGPIFGDRIILGDKSTGIDALKADHSFSSWLFRIVSWIYSPSSYADENRRTIARVKEYFTQQLGSKRFMRVCDRYQMNLKTMKSKGSPLLSRDIAKILVGIQDVKIEDIEDLVQFSKNEDEKVWPKSIDIKLRDELRRIPDLKGLSSENLSTQIFATLHEALSKAAQFVDVPVIDRKGMSGAVPTETLACFFNDPLLADRERLILSKENATHSFEIFVHNFVARIIGREMEVGMLIPAPNHEKLSIPQFYRVSAKIVSGGGMVSYILMPATLTTDLKSIQFFRGTTILFSGLDSSSTMIADMEKELGRSCYESGKIYEEILKKELGVISIGAGHSLGATTLGYFMANMDRFETGYFFNGPGLPSREVEGFNKRMREKAHLSTLRQIIIRDTNDDIFSLFGSKKLGFEAPNHVVEVDYRKYYFQKNTESLSLHVLVPGCQERYIGIEGYHNGKDDQAHLAKEEANVAIPAGISDDSDMSFVGNSASAIIASVSELVGCNQVGIAEENARIRANLDAEANARIRANLDAELHREAHPVRLVFQMSNEAVRQTIGPCIASIIRCVRNIFRWVFKARTLDQLGIKYMKLEEGKWAFYHVKPEQLSTQILKPS